MNLLLRLTPDEAKQFLLKISEEDLQLGKQLEEKVHKYLLKVNVDELALAVYQALNKLTLEDIYTRAGSRRFKYVEPAEAAYQVVEETHTPFAVQMDRFLELQMLSEFKFV